VSTAAGFAATSGDFFGGLMTAWVAGLAADLPAALVAGLPATAGLGVEEDEVAMGVKGVGVTNKCRQLARRTAY
jgi:hypothetical protein